MKLVNCLSDFRFQVDLTTPNGAGNLATPAAGAITGIALRLSRTKGGAAISATVDNLPATEADDTPGRFYVTVDAGDLETHVLTDVGDGGTFWAVWSKAGDADGVSVRFKALDGQQV